MKQLRIAALLLALAMLLPFAVACGSTQEGTPNSFSNVTITSTYDPSAEESTEEGAEPEEYEETIFSGEVIVYTETETAEITVLDLLRAYADAQNENLVYDSGTARVTKIGELGAGGGYFWNYVVNGADASLNTVIKGDDEIQIIFTK